MLSSTHLVPFRVERLPTLGDAIVAFLDDLVLEGRSPHTVTSYRQHLSHLPDGPLAAFDTQMGRTTIREAIAVLRPSSVRVRHAALSAFGRYCVTVGWLPHNPMAGVPCPRSHQPRHRYLTPAQVKQVWRAVIDSPRREPELELIVLLLLEGLRAAELCALRWEDIGDDKIHVTGKGQKHRTIPLSPMVRARLIRGEGRVFAFAPSSLWSRIRRLGQRAGVPLHPHLFRKTWATLGLLAGMDSRHIQTLGGWSKPEMVEYYARSGMQEAALDHARTVDLTSRLLD